MELGDYLGIDLIRILGLTFLALDLFFLNISGSTGPSTLNLSLQREGDYIDLLLLDISKFPALIHWAYKLLPMNAYNLAHMAGEIAIVEGVLDTLFKIGYAIGRGVPFVNFIFSPLSTLMLYLE